MNAHAAAGAGIDFTMQTFLADSAIDLYGARLMVLHAAFVAQGLEAVRAQPRSHGRAA